MNEWVNGSRLSINWLMKGARETCSLGSRMQIAADKFNIRLALA